MIFISLSLETEKNINGRPEATFHRGPQFPCCFNIPYAMKEKKYLKGEGINVLKTQWMKKLSMFLVIM